LPIGRAFAPIDDMLRVACCLILLSGCTSECREGESHCLSTTTARDCVWVGGDVGGHAEWQTSKCNVACVNLQGYAACVLSATPIPECAGVGSTCWNGSLTSCEGGYPTSKSSCGDGTSCVQSSCGGLCVYNTQLDARCDPNQQPLTPSDAPTTFCESGNAEGCSCGYVVKRVPCYANDRCRVMGGQAQCTLSPSPDPRCGDPSRPGSGFCDGNDAYSCWYGYTVAEGICPPGSCFVDAQRGTAGCQLPVSPSP
jgi:hypothetical protein